MTEYFITVMAVALAGGVIISLVPTGRTLSYVRLLCGLCTLCCVAFPLVNIVGGEFDKEEILSMFESNDENREYYDEIYNKKLTKAEIENANFILKSEIIKAFSLKSDAIDINIITNNDSDEIYILKVGITLHKSGVDTNPRELKDFVFERLGCETEIFYDI